VIPMTIKSLFDETRRKALQNAIRKGEDAFSGNGRVKPGGGQDERPKTLGETFGYSFSSSDELVQVGNRKYSVDDFLLLAIQFSDIEAVRRAVGSGADVNRNHSPFMLPINPSVTDDTSSRTIVPSVSTPLQYSESLGNFDIASYLRRHGAKE
jgi:hypothetical protein